jgi:hypothetical protein
VRVVSPLTRRFRFAAPLGLFFGVLSTWLSVGCGGDVKTTICEAQCTCANNCNDTATEACVKALDSNIQKAASVGCNANAEADTYFNCESERATCAGGNYANNACTTETQTFFVCLASKKCSYVFSENRVDCDL